ncbi:hypothetical protein ACHQM5_030471 [Ranunculus cassubicifolius]
MWLPPQQGTIKLNTDGAARGCPGPAGLGISCRNHQGDFLGIFTQGLGICNNYWAEFYAVLAAMELAQEKGWREIWIETDSKAVVSAIYSHKLAWRIFFFAK